jgi:redox-regulated HSP33 family molecular chaperone
VKENKIFQTSFAVKDGFGKVISQKQHRLDSTDTKEGRNALMLLIKPGKETPYSSVVDMLDEALIHDIKRYALVTAEKEEMEYLEKREN